MCSHYWIIIEVLHMKSIEGIPVPVRLLVRCSQCSKQRWK